MECSRQIDTNLCTVQFVVHVLSHSLPREPAATLSRQHPLVCAHFELPSECHIVKCTACAVIHSTAHGDEDKNFAPDWFALTIQIRICMCALQLYFTQFQQKIFEVHPIILKRAKVNLACYGIVACSCILRANPIRAMVSIPNAFAQFY